MAAGRRKRKEPPPARAKRTAFARARFAERPRNNLRAIESRESFPPNNPSRVESSRLRRDAPCPRRDPRSASARSRSRAAAQPCPKALHPLRASGRKRAHMLPRQACACASSPTVCIHKPSSRHFHAKAFSRPLSQFLANTSHPTTREVISRITLDDRSDRALMRCCVGIRNGRFFSPRGWKKRGREAKHDFAFHFGTKEAKCKTGCVGKGSTRCSCRRCRDIQGAEEIDFRRPEGQAKTGRKQGEYRPISCRIIEKYS